MDYNSTGAMRSPFSPRVRQSIAGRRPIGLNSAKKNQSKYMQSQEEQGGDVIYKTPTLTVETYGAPLPVMVTEALTFASNDVSVKVSPSGWCWVIWGRRILAWSRGPSARGSEPTSPSPVTSPAARELTLPQTDLAHKADLVEIFYEEGAQMASCIGVSPEGVVRYWPSVAQEGVYTDVSCELAGQECDRLAAPERPGSLVLATTTCTLVVITPTVIDGRATVQCKTLRPPSGWLGGIGRRVSLLFFGSMPAHADTKLVGVVCIGEGWSESPSSGERVSGCVALVAAHGGAGGPVLQLWTPHHTHEHALRRHLTDTPHHHYHGDPTSLEIAALEVQPAPAGPGLLLLLAIVNVARSPDLRYAIAHISVEDPARPVVTSLTALRGAAEPEPAPAPRCLPLAAHLLLYSPSYIALVPTGNNNESAEYIDVGHAEDRILAGAVCGGAALAFSLRHGVVRLAVAARAPAAPAPPAPAPDAGLALLELDPHEVGALLSDAGSQLKTAFLFHLRRDAPACRALLADLFPQPSPAVAQERSEDVDAALDRSVVGTATEMLDDQPAGDPRWKPRDPRPTNIALGSSSALQVLAQLQDKKRAFTLFLDFLRATGLWQRMQALTFEGAVVRTSVALGALAERLAAAIALRTLQHQQDEPLIDAAIYTVVSGPLADEEEAALLAEGALAPPDVCYRRVSRVPRVLLALCEPRRAAHATHAAHHALHTINVVNHVLSEMHKCRAQWQGRALGPRGLVPALLQLERRAVVECARECTELNLRAQVLEAAAALADLLLAEAAPLQDDPHTDHLYRTIRRDAIKPFLEEGQTERAAVLAEKFRDFELLIELCIDGEDLDRLTHYVDKYIDEGVAELAFAAVVDRGGAVCARLAARARGRAGARLTAWLRAGAAQPQRAQLLAARLLALADHAAAADALLAYAEDTTFSLNRAMTAASLAKLCLAAGAGAGGAGAGGARRRVDARLALCEHHAALPRDLRLQHGLDDGDCRLYSPEELIQMYIECESRALTEYDYKKALDLTDYVDDPERRDDLRLRVWCACIARDEWAPASCRLDSPAEDLPHKMFFRLIDLVHVMGGDMELLLPPVEDILTAPELAELVSDPRIQYIIKYGYECLDTNRHHSLIEA